MLYVGILFCPKPTSTSCKITTLFISSLIFETNFHQRFLSKYLSQMFNILTDIIELGMQYIHILFSTNWMSTPVKWRIWLFHLNFKEKISSKISKQLSIANGKLFTHYLFRILRTLGFIVVPIRGQFSDKWRLCLFISYILKKYSSNISKQHFIARAWNFNTLFV